MLMAYNKVGPTQHIALTPRVRSVEAIISNTDGENMWIVLEINIIP